METQTLEPYLKEHDFFKGLSDEHMALLTGCARLERFDAGEMLFRQGDPAEYFFLIRYGMVAIEIQAPFGGAITIATLSDGDVLGWSWLMEPYICRFDARAVLLTRAFLMDGTCLRRKCEEDPVLGYHLLKRFSQVVAERLEAARIQLLDVYGQAKETRS